MNRKGMKKVEMKPLHETPGGLMHVESVAAHKIDAEESIIAWANETRDIYMGPAKMYCCSLKPEDTKHRHSTEIAD